MSVLSVGVGDEDLLYTRIFLEHENIILSLFIYT